MDRVGALHAALGFARRVDAEIVTGNDRIVSLSVQKSNLDRKRGVVCVSREFYQKAINHIY